MAGPQVRLGGGWKCDPSQTTSGDATVEGADDDGVEDDVEHPATTMAAIASEIANLLMPNRRSNLHAGSCPLGPVAEPNNGTMYHQMNGTSRFVPLL
jgi:hypothetical protein